MLRVLLLLVRKDSIVKYNIHTFPVLKNDSHVTTRLNAVKEVAWLGAPSIWLCWSKTRGMHK